MFFSIKMSDEAFAHLQSFMQGHLGIRTPESKKPILEGRLNKRLRAHGYNSYEPYIDYLESEEGQKHELPILIDLVTTHKTHFFREHEHFLSLKPLVLNQLVPAFKKKGNRSIKIWCCAASTGQEPYTIAMTMAETLKDTNVDFEILATDVSTGVLKIAQNGIYSINEAEEIPSRFRQTYILKSKNPDDRLMRIRPNIREKVRYQALNLVAENYPLREHFDIIFCRNVMIYFDKQTQNRIVNQLYAYTNKNGLLVLGQAEGSASQNTAYKRMRGTIFQKR